MASSAKRAAKKTTPENQGRAAGSAAQPVQHHPYVVGIGASAGGLEALSALISALPTDLGVAFVVLQHLSPNYRSMLVQLLGRETAMAVREVEAGAVPEPDVIYVAPASRNLVLKDGHFQLVDALREAMPKPSVNAFFSALAADRGEDAIGVILSGTGSDGAAGLREIKAAGGFTFVQEPTTAKYSGMPQSAIDSGCVDWVLPAAGIAAELAAIVRSRPTLLAREQQPHPPATALKKLLMKVKHRTRIDFGGYKEGTLWRRIERRMAASHVGALDDYLDLVDRSPEELDRLCKDILISVTAFFRDPDSFGRLKDAIGEIVAQKEPGDEIRIWVAGCATGEEVYSIAILLAEALGSSVAQYKIQIFATDIDNEAMALARRGLYPEASLAELDPALVARHLQPQRGRFEISRLLRDMVVFARQDLIQDPPFLRLDLVSCRNVLIYFNNDLQAKVLATFHYGLRQDGFLFLGKSEGIFQQEALFEVIDKTHRLFRRRPGEARLPLSGFHLPSLAAPPAPPPRSESEQRLLDAAVRAYVPATILVSASFDILHVHGDVSAFVGLSAGKPSLNLHNLIRREFRTDLQLLHHQAESRHEVAVGRGRQIKVGDGQMVIRVAVHPLDKSPASPYLVSFETVAADRPGLLLADAEGGGTVHTVRQVEDELTATRERLQTVIEEMETSNEEMQALNEEVQASNEELQSSNEEMEAANEELQSTNEELTTVNEELQIRSSELAEALNALEQIQNSAGFPIMVCSEQLRLIRANRPAASLFALGPAAIGQPLGNLRLPPGMGDFTARIALALDSQQTLDEPLFSSDRHYLMRVAPYDTVSGGRGAVITLMDDTERLARERQLRESQQKMLAIMDNSTAIITMKDLAGRYEFVNRQFERLFKVNAAEVLGRTDFQIFTPGIADYFRARELAVVGRRRALEQEDHVTLPDGDRYLLSIRFPLMDPDQVIYGICTQSTDITGRKKAEEQLRLVSPQGRDLGL